jgi:hypothetical protein
LALFSRNISSTEEENMRAFFAPAKRTRFLVALGLALLMATPAVMIWANKAQLKPSVGADVSDFEAHLEEAIARRLMGVQLPMAFASSPEFAPFGGPIKAKVLSGDSGRGKLLTNLGHEDWDAGQSALIGRVPPGLRAAKGVIQKTERGSLRPGLNYVQLSAEAIASRGLNSVMTSVGSHGRIAGMLPERTIILHVSANQMQSLRSNPDVERTRAFEPYNKDRPRLRRAADDQQERGEQPRYPGQPDGGPGSRRARPAQPDRQSSGRERADGPRVRLRLYAAYQL